MYMHILYMPSLYDKNVLLLEIWAVTICNQSGRYSLVKVVVVKYTIKVIYHRLNFRWIGFALSMMNYDISNCVFLTLLDTFTHTTVVFSLCEVKEYVV